MFDIGFSELALVGVVALLVVGPKKLPELARTAGAWLGKARRMIATVKADVDRELKTDELRKLLSQQQEEVNQLRQILTDTHTGLEADVKDAMREPSAVKKPLAAAPVPALDTTTPGRLDNTAENPDAPVTPVRLDKPHG